MLTNFKKQIDTLTEKMPDWDERVFDFLSNNEEENKSGQKAIEELTIILDEVIKYAKQNDIPIDEVTFLFKGKKSEKYIIAYIQNYMDKYNDYKALRELEKSDQFMAKYCVDMIWSNYILRYDPFEDFKSNIQIDNESFNAIAIQLDAFVDRCISQLLTERAMSKALMDDSGLSENLCRYIADLINNDFEKLKLNYIVSMINKKQ